MVRWNHSEIPDKPSEKCIREFAEHNNLDYETATKYFRNFCSCCGKPIRHKYEIGMCMKYGMSSNNYICKSCFCDVHGITTDEYDSILESFRYRSCDLV